MVLYPSLKIDILYQYQIMYDNHWGMTSKQEIKLCNYITRYNFFYKGTPRRRVPAPNKDNPWEEQKTDSIHSQGGKENF